MEKYFIYILGSIQAKNKAQEEALKLIDKYDNILIHGSFRYQEFKSMIKDEIQEINERNKRCADISISAYSFSSTIRCISIGDLYTINSRLVKEEWI